MPLDFQIKQTAFSYGIDEGTDPKSVPFGTLTVCKNLVWKKSNRLEQRRGVDAVTKDIVGGGELTSAARLILRDTELAVTDGATLHSLTLDGWVSRGKHPEAGLEWETTQDTIDGIKTYELARLDSGVVVEAWTTGDPTLRIGDDSTLYYQLVYPPTGAVVSSPLIVNTDVAYGSIRIVTDGTNWCLLYIRTSGDLWCVTQIGATLLASDAMTSDVAHMRVDACAIGGGLFTVAYTLDGGGLALKTFTFGAVPALSVSGAVTTASTAIEAVSLTSTLGEKLYVAYWDTTTEKLMMAIHDPATLVQTVAPFTLDDQSGQNLKLPNVGLARSSSTSCRAAYSFCTTADKDESPGVLKTQSVSSTGTPTAEQASYYTRLLSRPFLIGAAMYAVVGNWSLADTFSPTGTDPDGVTGSDVFLVDLAYTGIISARLVGKIEWIVGGVWGPGYVANVSTWGTSAYVPSPFLSAEANNFVAWRQGTKRVTVTTGASVPLDMWRSITIGQEGYLAAGVLTAYDGVLAAPSGWAYPVLLDPSNTVRHQAGGGSIEAGTYLYNVTGERRSAVGTLHRAPIGTTLRRALGPGNDGDTTLTIIPNSLSWTSFARSLLAIYRTVKNGSVLQRLTIEPTYAVVVNVNNTGPALTYDDVDPDAGIGNSVDLATRPALYTESGELEDFQPPGIVTQCLYRGRIFAILGDRTTLVFSKSFTQNPGIAPGFHPSFRILFNDVLTGLAVLDERLIIFSETGIYTLAGDGPTVTGDNSDFVSPNKLQTDVGCSNPRSLCSTAEGIFFEWNSDICLLTRTLEIVWIGKRARDLLTTYPVITSGVVVAKRNEVRFTANTADGSAGIVLAFNYAETQWSHFEYFGGTPFVDAILAGGAYTLLTADGQVYQENEASTLDEGFTFVPTTMETAWIHYDGPLSYYSMRNVMLDGISATPHGLEVSVGYNGESAYDAPRVWAEQITGATLPGPVAPRVSIGPRRKCRSIRFKIERTAPSMLGISATANSWSAMAIEYGTKKGVGKVPVAQTK